MMDVNQFLPLLEPGLRKVFFDGYKEEPEVYPKVFSVESSDKHTETFYRVAGLTAWKPFTGAVEYEDYAPGEKYFVSHVTYARGISIPMELAEDDLYGVIGTNGNGPGGRQARQLGRGARIAAEIMAAEVFNRGFDPNKTIYDGKPYFATDHPLIKPATLNQATTYSNKITSPLTPDGIKQARLLLAQTPTDEGIPVNFDGAVLLVPPALEYTALEIMRSETVPYSADRTANVLRGLVRDVIVWTYLTDNNNWFIFDPRWKENRVFYWRVKPQFMSDKDQDHFRLKFVGRMRASVAILDWRGIVGAEAA